jgi:hypothetical protein
MPKADEEDPLFGDIDQELALNLSSAVGNRIEFLRAG